MLEKQAVDRALLHLTSLGDTDIFPAPFEFVFYADKSAEISDIVCNIDTSKYQPKSCVEVLSPKRALSFRIAHQLYPSDTLLYTSAVIQIAPSLENLRLDPSKGPFSYRYVDDANEPRLFLDSSSFHDWLVHVKEMFTPENSFESLHYVIETDISDFYSRIYFHRIEHILDDCEASNSVRKVIEGIIKFSRARQSYGLPVGTSASRLLAEGLLNDSDRMIIDRSLKYSRYVDDFRIVVNEQHEVHATLCRLAEHLMLSEGLSLNSSKTRTYTTDVGIAHIDEKLSDVFNDDELNRLNQYIRHVYDDELISVEDIEEVDPVNLGNKLIEILNRDTIDYSSARVILKALRAVEHPDPIALTAAAEELLYYTPRDFCLMVGSFAERNIAASGELADLLISVLNKSPYSEMTLSRIWVAHLFVSQALPITRNRIELLNLTKSVIERRQNLLLLGIIKDRAFFREKKTRFDESSDWEKAALMLGASCLSKGEYKTWLDTIKGRLADPFEELYRKWLLENQAVATDKLKIQFKIKSKADRIAEAFDDDDDDNDDEIDFPF